MLYVFVVEHVCFKPFVSTDISKIKSTDREISDDFVVGTNHVYPNQLGLIMM